MAAERVEVCIMEVSVSCESVRLALANPEERVDPERPEIIDEEEMPDAYLVYEDGKLEFCYEDEEWADYMCADLASLLTPSKR